MGKTIPMIQRMAKEHPEAADNIKAALTVGSVLPVAAAEEKVISPLLGGTRNKLNSASDSLVKPVKSTVETPSASDLYTMFKDQGLKLDKDQMGKFSSGLDSLRPKDKLLAATWAEHGIPQHIKTFKDAMSEGSISLEGMLSRRSELNSDIRESFKNGKDNKASSLIKMRNAIDDALISSDKSGTWQMANHEFAKEATADTLEEMVARASTKQQPANALDTAINKYLMGPQSKGLRDAERKALEEVVKNTKTGNLKKAAGSGLFKYAASGVLSKFGPVGKGAGYLLGHYGSEFAKDAAMKTKVDRLGKVYDLIKSRELPKVTASEAKKAETLLLAAPDKMSPLPMSKEKIQHQRKVLEKTGKKKRPVGPSGAPITEDKAYYPTVEDEFSPKASGGKVGFNLKKPKK